MKWTNAFIPTLREAPADAEIVSHKLLLRAGLIRKLAGGVYTFLPLGLRALRKVEQIIREEMDRAGALEVLMPALQPPEIWQQSGRYETASNVLFKVKDSGNREWVLSPTAEEVITTLAANEINSYRQLPKNFYQISVKFRDEIRPRFGLMRAKEFIMKDAYSFDTTRRRRDGQLPENVRRLHAHLCAVRAEGVSGRGRHRRHRRQLLARIHGARRDRRERSGVLAKPAVTRRTSRRPPAAFPKPPRAKSARPLKNLPRPAS